MLLNQGIQKSGSEMCADVARQPVKNGIQRRHRASQMRAKQGLQGGGVFKQPVQVHTQHIARSVAPAQAIRQHRTRHIASTFHGRMLRSLTVVNFIA